MGGGGDRAQRGQRRRGNSRRLIPLKSAFEEAAGGVPVLQAQQVGRGGQARPDNDLPGLPAPPPHGPGGNLRPERAQLSICRGPDVSRSGTDCLRNARVHPEGHHLVLAVATRHRRPGLDQGGCCQGVQQRGRCGRVAGPSEPAPQVRPVSVDDDGVPVAVFDAGQELGHQLGRFREGVQSDSGPGAQGVQELGRAQSGGAVAEERVQHQPSASLLGRGQLGRQPSRVGSRGVGEFHQLGMALHHPQHPADQVPVSRHRLCRFAVAQRAGVGVQQPAQAGQLPGQRRRLIQIQRMHYHRQHTLGQSGRGIRLVRITRDSP